MSSYRLTIISGPLLKQFLLIVNFLKSPSWVWLQKSGFQMVCKTSSSTLVVGRCKGRTVMRLLC